LDLSKCTPVTPETFAKWKAERVAKKEQEVAAAKKAAAKKGGADKGLHMLSGRGNYFVKTVIRSFFVSFRFDDDHTCNSHE
jgi:hypothetical protein